jgi:hypothetical protein
MNRPAVEVADILHAQGERFLDRYRTSFSYQQLKAFRTIGNCRTQALGDHLDARTARRSSVSGVFPMPGYLLHRNH